MLEAMVCRREARKKFTNIDDWNQLIESDSLNRREDSIYLSHCECRMQQFSREFKGKHAMTLELPAEKENSSPADL